MKQHPQLIFARSSCLLVCLLAALGSVAADAKEPGELASEVDQSSGLVILEDDFNRVEADPLKEQIGNEWGTNRLARAQAVKQVHLLDGAMKITRAKVADHGVSESHAGLLGPQAGFPFVPQAIDLTTVLIPGPH